MENMKNTIINHAGIASWYSLRPILIAAVCLSAPIFVCDFQRLFSQSFVPILSNEQKNGLSDVSFLIGVSSETFSGAPYRTFPLQERFFSGDMPPKKIASKFDRICEKWGVVTTINAPTQSINNVAELLGWCLVVVGDQKTPEPYKLPVLSGSYYLGKNEQEDFCSKFDDFCTGIPWNHFGRKNIGYLYAIAHGAKQIWDFDDDNVLLTANPPQISDGISMMQAHGMNDCHVFNPYPIMGGPLGEEHPSWPRGLPLDLISRPCDFNVEEVKNPLEIDVGIIQSLANNEPDVDAIYRLTRGTPFDFDEKNKWIVLDENLLAPYNAQATVIYGTSLWSLLLPMTVHSRVSDIWRSYIAQRLMKDIGVRVAFSPPHVRQDRNKHNLLGDLKAEDALYHQTPSLCKFLHSWSGSTGSLPGRFEELVVALYERGFLEIQDVYMAQKWISALFCAGYAFPALSDNVTEMAFVPGQEQGPSSIIKKARTQGTGEGSNSRRMSDIAVCIRGYDRRVNNAENILESIITPLAADVFAVVQTEDGAAPGMVTKLKAAAGDYRNYSPDEILAEMEADGLNKTFWLGVENQNSLAQLGGSQGSALVQYKSLKRCLDIISDHELNERRGRKYQNIVIVRSDHWCIAQPFCLSKPEMNDKILVPIGEDYGGLNDRIIAFPRRAAKSILSGAWAKLTKNTRTEDFSANTELVHLSNVKDTNIPLLRTNVTCFIACAPGVSQTSWATCKTLPPEVTQNDTTLRGAQGMKYQNEFLAAWNKKTFLC